MKILQQRDRKWYLNKQRIVSASNDLSDIILCKEQCSYATMHSYYLVMENYDETHHTLMGSYTALLRFYESYTQSARWVWLNRDHGSEILEERFGKKKAFVGELNKQNFKEVREEIKKMGGRYLVIKRDWLIRFRDFLILTCYLS